MGSYTDSRDYVWLVLGHGAFARFKGYSGMS